ncbi:BrnA antitoxin family protein [Parasphingorhabdus sp.]|uniref:BrnA antitoxin family protein n=1 Tax=Parasphingorhabdus sp. TaxID=2709688 RepID=UPI003A93651F
MTKKSKEIVEPWLEPEDLTEWTEDQFRRAAVYKKGKLVRPADGTLTKPGRPKLQNPKQQVTLRLDKIVLEKFKASGAGWQTRINEELRKALNL